MNCEKSFSFPFKYLVFSQIPSHHSIKLLQDLKKAHSLQITPKLVEALQSLSRQHHDEAWKSIWACGINWIISFCWFFQRGGPFLNYVLHSITHGEENSLYMFNLDLFLKGASNFDDSQFYVQRLLIEFSNMQGKYVFHRTIPLSEALLRILDILDDKPFFRELQHFCYQDFGSQLELHRNFLHFCQSMRHGPPEKIFEYIFEPQVFVFCKICNAKICHSIHLLTLKMCEKCVKRRSPCGWDGLQSKYNDVD